MQHASEGSTLFEVIDLSAARSTFMGARGFADCAAQVAFRHRSLPQAYREVPSSLAPYAVVKLASGRAYEIRPA